jgi:peptidyl-prolyl cis-trans isomerase B (cyclophilin B)
MRWPAPGAVAVVLALAACTADPTPTPKPTCPTEPPTATSAQATLEGAEVATLSIGGDVTGEFAIELYGEQAPIATANFVALARCGFYDGIAFHRIINGFVIQAGDPDTKAQPGNFTGIGDGGPGYDFEIEPPADGLRYEPYSVSMANNTIANGSQFFVALDDLDDGLRQAGVYTIFGQVVSGTETVDAIAAVPVNDPRQGTPLATVLIESITVSSGDDAPEGDS